MGAINLTQIRHLVLDEADRMLEMGFEDQVRDILDNLPPQRQTCLFSATWPREIEQLANSYLNNPGKLKSDLQHTFVSNRPSLCLKKLTRG